MLVQRKLIVGDILQPLTPLFLIINENEKYSIKILVSAINSQKIAIGQIAAISLDKYPKEQFGEINVEIISLPYKNIDSNTLVADANIINRGNESLYKKLPPITDESGTAFIIIENKRLLSKFIK